MLQTHLLLRHPTYVMHDECYILTLVQLILTTQTRTCAEQIPVIGRLCKKLQLQAQTNVQTGVRREGERMCGLKLLVTRMENTT